MVNREGTNQGCDETRDNRHHPELILSGEIHRLLDHHREQNEHYTLRLVSRAAKLPRPRHIDKRSVEGVHNMHLGF